MEKNDLHKIKSRKLILLNQAAKLNLNLVNKWKCQAILSIIFGGRVL